MRYFVVACIFVLACYLRINDLGKNAFWMDECIYLGMEIQAQELVPRLLRTDTDNEFIARLPFAIAGSLTVLALFWVIPDKKLALFIGLFYAVFPLFVWWSRLCRPYSIAGLFMVLAWRLPWAMYLALLSTPISIIGMKFLDLKKHRYYLISFFVLAAVIYFLRTDYDRGHWSIVNIIQSTRWFYLPSLAVLVWAGHIPYLSAKFRIVEADTFRGMSDDGLEDGQGSGGGLCNEHSSVSPVFSEMGSATPGGSLRRSDEQTEGRG